MTFEEWWDSDERMYFFDWEKEGDSFPKDLVRAAWNAAIEAAAQVVEKDYIGVDEQYKSDGEYLAEEIRALKD